MSEHCEIRMLEAARPIGSKERIQTLDVLRGFALFGIMFVNVYAFVHPEDWFHVQWQELGTLEYAMELFKLLFTQGKFYSLFAFLFGLGFAVQLASAERRGNQFAGLFFWRLVVLYLIALLHFIFIWDGDILNAYAAAGMLLLLCYGLKRMLDVSFRSMSKTRDKAPRWLMLAVAGFLLSIMLGGWGAEVYKQAQIVQQYEAGVELSEADQEFIDSHIAFRTPEAIAERAQQQLETLEVFRSGSYIDVVEIRMEKLKPRFFGMFPFWLMILSVFLIGAYFGRNNFIARAAELKAGFVKLGIGSLIIGIPSNVLFVYAVLNKPENAGQFWQWLAFSNKTISGLAFALFYVSIITLAMMGPAKRYLQHLAPVGRMALTCYLMQSLVGSWVFYGYGFGMVGQLNAFEQLGFQLALFGFQMVFCRWWLSQYRFGPMEWLWRSLTYRKLQPMRNDQSTIEPQTVSR